MLWKKGRKSRMNEQELNQQELENQAQHPEDEFADAPVADAEAPREDGAQEPIDVEALAAAAAKAEEYLTLCQRVQADFDNFRRRNESVRADALNEGQRKVAAAMLPVLDNLERALAASQDAQDALRTGVEMTHKQMLAVYEKLGVAPIDRAGEKFDPTLEEAVLQGTAEDGEPGTVCQVLQKGYTMNGTVLRHAMVKVVPD